MIFSSVMDKNSFQTRAKDTSIIATLATLLVLSGVATMLSPTQQLAFADEGKDKTDDHKKDKDHDKKKDKDHDKKKDKDHDHKKKDKDHDHKKDKDKLKDKLKDKYAKFAYKLVERVLAEL